MAVATAANTTTAFTLPSSRSSNTPADKKKQLKKLQQNWKAARLRNAIQAKVAAHEESEQVGEYREWSMSALFLSVFFCGEVMDVATEEEASNDLFVPSSS